MSMKTTLITGLAAIVTAAAPVSAGTMWGISGGGDFSSTQEAGIQVRRDPNIQGPMVLSKFEWEDWLDDIKKRTGKREVPSGYYAVLGTTYGYKITVKKGDTLEKLAREMSGIAEKKISWNTLYEENKDVIGENPDLIKPGILLKCTTREKYHEAECF